MYQGRRLTPPAIGIAPRAGKKRPKPAPISTWGIATKVPVGDASEKRPPMCGALGGAWVIIGA